MRRRLLRTGVIARLSEKIRFQFTTALFPHKNSLRAT
jgi:hypothetical protein